MARNGSGCFSDGTSYRVLRSFNHCPAVAPAVVEPKPCQFGRHQYASGYVTAGFSYASRCLIGSTPVLIAVRGLNSKDMETR